MALLSLTLAGCYKVEYSSAMTEKGQVLDLYMTPGRVDHNTMVNTNSHGRVSVQSYVNEVPAKYSVMFRCEHGVRFVITGSDDLHRELYQRMVKNADVTISYRNIYHVDNKTHQKTLNDYDFLDANVIKTPMTNININ